MKIYRLMAKEKSDSLISMRDYEEKTSLMLTVS